MQCEWNTAIDGFADPFKKDPGDCQQPATVTLGRHPWAFVCESCVKSKKLKSFHKRSMRAGASIKEEMDDKGETAGLTQVTTPVTTPVTILRRKRVEH